MNHKKELLWNLWVGLRVDKVWGEGLRLQGLRLRV